MARYLVVLNWELIVIKDLFAHIQVTKGEEYYLFRSAFDLNNLEQHGRGKDKHFF